MKVTSLLPEVPQSLQDMAEHVARLTREEAERLADLGIPPAEAAAKAMRTTAAARAEVNRMVAEWASFQAPKVVITPD